MTIAPLRAKRSLSANCRLLYSTVFGNNSFSSRALRSDELRGDLVQHVLLVGGEPPIFDVVQSALRSGGYRVTRAASTEEAMALLEREPPSLAIIDSALPGMPRLELALKAGRQAVAVLLLVDRPDPARTRPGFQTLSKPIALDELLERSRALIAEATRRHRILTASRKKLLATRHALHAVVKHVQDSIANVRRASAQGSGCAQSYDLRADPVLRSALAYWQAKRGTRAMPRRRDIDASELPKQVLPQLQLIDVIEGGQEFFYRLVGTALVEAFGREFTGKYTVDVVAADQIEFLHGCYRKVVAARRPIFVRSTYLTRRPFDVTANRLLMPLSEDGERVSMIFGALTFEPVAPGERRQQPDLSSAFIHVVP